MKPIRIQFEGIESQNGAYEFDNYAGGAVLLTDVDAGVLASAVRFALFGGEVGGEQSRVELRFAVGEREYVLLRMREREGNDITESALVQDPETEEFYVTGAAEVTEFVQGLTKVKEGLFEKIFLLPKEDVAGSLADAEKSVVLLSEVFNVDVTAEDIEATLAELKEGERQLLNHIEELGAVDKKRINEQKQQIERSLRDKNDAQKELELAAEDKKKLDAYDQAAAEQAAYAAEREKLEGSRAEIEEYAAKVEASAKAVAVKEAYEREAHVREELEGDKEALKDRQKEREALAKKIADGEKSFERFKQNFMENSVRAEEWQAALMGAVRGVDGEENLAYLREAVEAQYAAQIAEAKAAESELQAMADEIRTKEERLVEIRQQKQGMAVSAEYRNAVAEGCILETRLQQVDARVQQLKEKLTESQKAHANLTDSEGDVAKKEADCIEKQKTLEDAIKGSYPTIKDAVNADVYYKQTLYSKHLAVSMQEVELRAVLEKMEAVRKVNEGYRAKTETLMKRKGEVETHRQKLMLRLEAVEEKLRDLITRNRLRKMADEAEYGSRCPICDSYVTVKKQLPVVSTAALDEQISQLKAEIEKDTTAINEAMNSIGQYQAAEKVSAQYLDSLNETKEAKEKLINDVLNEYNATDTPDLFAKVRIAVEKSNQLTIMIDRYHAAGTELARIKGVRDGMKEELKRLEAAIARYDAELTELMEVLKKDVDRYALLQTHYNGENAVDLNEKLYVITNEYEKLEGEESAIEESLGELRKKEEELRVALTLTFAHGTPLVRKGKEYDYLYVIANTLGERYRALADAADAAANPEEAKLKLAAIGKVVNNYKEEAAKLDDEITAIESAITAKEEVLAILTGTEEQISALGVSKVEDLDTLILGSALADSYTMRIADYQEAVRRLDNWLQLSSATMEEYNAYNEQRAEIEARLVAAKQSADDALIAYDRATEMGKTQIESYDDYTRSSQLLTLLQEKLAYAAENADLIEDGVLNIEKVRARIISEASRKVRRLSKDRYDLSVNSAGQVQLRRIKKNEAVNPEKATVEEKTLLTLALSLGYVDLILKVAGGGFMPVLFWAQSENNVAGVQVLSDFAKDLLLAVLPEDESGFFKAISQLEV